ncbi:sterol desaturase family protein [Pseudohalioglobus sediminis]|uniref:Sterol desaturase family protein n=1 Tax=Pseudohalioglobus sediminis TaxID=2606449 RepID=A0A5B0WT91_9GAMM|nr:sterol desaturase family protein [Pseudohalioglobus sediminis]KAA1189451.1 sterol desaturase family protein [Pseudohalioglobus sediminis]
MTTEQLLESFSQDKLLYVFIPIFLVAVVLEYRYSVRHKLALYQRQDTVASFWMMAFTPIVEFLPKLGAFVAFYYLHEISPLRDVVQRQWWAWALLLLLDDFVYYWFHRSNHEVRIFWAGHVTHHSAIKMNYATALRQGVGERLHKFLFWMPLPLLGFDPLMIFTVMAINLFYQFWIHTELVDRLPAPVEYLFNTPSHHRVHHASNVRYLDCNHGGILIIWDRLFGTFSEETQGDAPRYGLTKNITSYRPLDVATHEYRSIWDDCKRATSWRDRWRYLLLAPGWSHDGEDRRARVLRRQLAAGAN